MAGNQTTFAKLIASHQQPFAVVATGAEERELLRVRRKRQGRVLGDHLSASLQQVEDALAIGRRQSTDVEAGQCLAQLRFHLSPLSSRISSRSISSGVCGLTISCRIRSP